MITTSCLFPTLPVLGTLELRSAVTSDGEALIRVHFLRDTPPACPPSPSALLSETERQLRAYLDRKLTRFDLPLAPQGTPFQQTIWRALLHVPYGQTLSYGRLAALAGHPGAARATGAACGRNPIAIIIPCHRIVGAHGRLTGYNGGLERKQSLLALEQTSFTTRPCDSV